jgi:hypothetical protein
MVAQRERRDNPYPLTWEVPLAVFAGSLLVLVLGVHLGRALASLTLGGTWVWPAATHLFGSAIGVLQGDGGAGLPAAASSVDSEALFGWVLAVEIVTIVVYGLLVWVGLRRWGPNRVLGLASAEDARRLLGRQRLHAVRRVVRPDLYGSRAPR